MKNFINRPAIFSIILGGAITWFFSYLYYAKAGEELLEETARLRTLHNTTLRALENLQNENARFQISPDAKGDLTKMGVNVNVQGSEATTSAPQATAVAK